MKPSDFVTTLERQFTVPGPTSFYSGIVGARRGGGTTVPGKLLGSSIRARSTGSRRGCPAGSALVSATNGKTTTAAMAAEILAPRHALAHNASGANLMSGVASDAARGAAAPSSGCSRSTRRRCRRSRRASGRGPSASATSSATSSTATASSSSSRSAGAPRSRALPGDAALVVNGDDPQVGELARERAGRARLRRRRPERRAAVAPACRRLEVLRRRAGRRTSTPPRTSGTSATTAAQPAGTRGRRSTSSRARSSSRGLERRLVHARHAGGNARACGCACPASTTSTTRSPPRRSRARSASRSTTIAAGLERFGAAFGRFERIAIGDRRAADAADQEPGGRERGDPDARRGRRAARSR